MRTNHHKFRAISVHTVTEGASIVNYIHSSKKNSKNCKLYPVTKSHQSGVRSQHPPTQWNGIRGAADEAVLNTEHRRKNTKIPLFELSTVSKNNYQLSTATQNNCQLSTVPKNNCQLSTVSKNDCQLSTVPKNNNQLQKTIVNYPQFK
jgi:hypothetical protein